MSVKRISLGYQFMFWIGLAVAVSVLATGWVIQARMKKTVKHQASEALAATSVGIQRMIETAMTFAIRSHLRGVAEKNVAVLEKLYQDSLNGKLTQEAARGLAGEILLSQPIGKTGYIYAIDGKGVIRVHPNKDMRNRDMSDHWLAKAQIAGKAGFLEYKWKNPGESQEREKVLYMAYFEPWDLIVSVSSYKSEFISLFDLEAFRSDILAFGSDKTGSVFVMDKTGQFLARSENRNLGKIRDFDQTWQGVVALMAAEKTGRLALPVKETDGKDELLVFFRYVPDLEWYVGSYIHLHEINARLDQVRTLIMAATALILALLLPLALFMGRAMTRPISRLAQDMDQAKGGNFNIRADETGLGEVGDLARHFNVYMDSLREVHGRLHQEVAQRDLAEGQLALFAEVFKNALEGISITDAQGTIIAVNQAFTDITGYTEAEALGQNPRILKSDRHDAAFYGEMWKNIREQGRWAGEIWNRRKTGEAYPEILSISAIKNRQNVTTHYVAVFHDISEMKSQQAAIEHQAFHDALTGLPNRYLAQDRLDMALRHARRQKERVAVFFLDMDNFKYVNDSLGHATGDLLLQRFGARLRHLVRDQDTVARLGGDEFLVIALDIRSDQEVLDLADRLLEGMQAPFEVDVTEIVVTFSLGITTFPQDGDNVQTLIKNADVAMYQSKAKGKNKYSVFTPELSAAAASRMDLVRELRQALNQQRFKVVYQPKVNPVSGRVTGVEALARWEKPDKTLVSPAEFIPLAEETGLILPLGRQILERACREISALNRQLPEPITLAVNLSPLQFGQPDILQDVLNSLAISGLSPKLLELEITETIMMTDLEASVNQLNVFKKQGISIAVDDFGTGYSSLYYLKTFPISALKIDRSFVRDMPLDQVDAKIVETIILMARNLGLRVVAEGVETQDQLALLLSYGCEEIQGFYFARPLSFEDARAYCMKMNRIESEDYEEI